MIDLNTLENKTLLLEKGKAELEKAYTEIISNPENISTTNSVDVYTLYILKDLIEAIESVLSSLDEGVNFNNYQKTIKEAFAYLALVFKAKEVQNILDVLSQNFNCNFDNNLKVL